MKKSKQPKQPEPHFQLMVSTYFKWCVDNKGDKPSFDGSSPRNLLLIVKQLRQRAEDKNIEWTELAAVTRLNAFLDVANTYQWLSDHWTLFNLDRQKDTIFFNIAKRNGTNKTQKSNH